MITNVLAEFATELVIHRVIGAGRYVHGNAVPFLKVESVALAAGAEENIGAAEVRLENLEPGEQSFGEGRKKIENDVLAIVIIGIELTREHKLARVTDTANGLPFCFCFG